MQRATFDAGKLHVQFERRTEASARAIERASSDPTAMKRSSVRGAKGPCHLQSLRRKEGKDEMIKASIDLQDLRRRIYVKVKAEPSWRFGRSCDTTILSDSQPNRGC